MGDLFVMSFRRLLGRSSAPGSAHPDVRCRSPAAATPPRSGPPDSARLEQRPGGIARLRRKHGREDRLARLQGALPDLLERAARKGRRRETRAGSEWARRLDRDGAELHGAGARGPWRVDRSHPAHVAVRAALCAHNSGSCTETPRAARNPADVCQNSEARIGFEPTYDGFANRCLTTWLPRRCRETHTGRGRCRQQARG